MTETPAGLAPGGRALWSAVADLHELDPSQLATQVVDRLSAHLEVRAQLGQGDNLLDQLELGAAWIGARSGRGVHDQQVRQPHRARPKDLEES